MYRVLLLSAFNNAQSTNESRKHATDERTQQYNTLSAIIKHSKFWVRWNRYNISNLALFKLNEFTFYIIEPSICARYQKVANDDDYNEDNDDDSRLHNITGQAKGFAHPFMFSLFFGVLLNWACRPLWHSLRLQLMTAAPITKTNNRQSIGYMYVWQVSLPSNDNNDNDIDIDNDNDNRTWQIWHPLRVSLTLACLPIIVYAKSHRQLPQLPRHMQCHILIYSYVFLLKPPSTPRSRSLYSCLFADISVVNTIYSRCEGK